MSDAPQPPPAQSSRKGRRVPKGTLTREQYDAMLAAFRERPADFQHAARVAGVAWNTAKKAWTRGWVKGGHGVPALPWAPPISEVIGHDQAEVQARVARGGAVGTPESVSEVEIVRRDALERKVEWARAAQGARRTATAVLSVNQRALSVVLARATEWMGELNSKPMSAADALRITRQIGLSTKLSAETLRLSQEVEAITVGSPTEILGLVPVTGERYNPDEAEEIIERAYSVVQRVRTLRKANGHGRRPPVIEVGEPVPKGDDPRLPG